MLYIYHVLYRFVGADASDWQCAGSHSTIDGARAAAFAIMAQHLNDGFNSKVRVYGHGPLAAAISHAKGAVDHAIDYTWRGDSERGFYERTDF